MTRLESSVWGEMARRKVLFHSDEKWNEIKLWGLFSWGAVSKLLKQGKLLTNMKKENRIIWVTPTKDSWENHIKPLVEKQKDGHHGKGRE